MTALFCIFGTNTLQMATAGALDLQPMNTAFAKQSIALFAPNITAHFSHRSSFIFASPAEKAYNQISPD